MSKIPTHAVPSPAGKNVPHDAGENPLKNSDQFIHTGATIEDLVRMVEKAEHHGA